MLSINEIENVNVIEIENVNGIEIENENNVNSIVLAAHQQMSIWTSKHI